jgi:hypothetical protein
VGAVGALTENDRAIRRFAQRLHKKLGVEQVLLYGAHAQGCTSLDYEYELILVSSHFRGIDRRDRQSGLHDLFYEVGGNAPLDLICLTPEEFESAKGRVTLVREVLPEAIDLLAEEPASA